MQLEDFLQKVKKPTEILTKGYSEEKIREMAMDDDNYEAANQLQALFSYAKATIDPSQKILAMQKRLREHNTPEEEITIYSIKMTSQEFPNPWSVQQAIADAFNLETLLASKNITASSLSLEYLYNLL